MGILDIALKDVKIVLKDIKALMFIILMPIVIICVLGISLNSIFDKDKVVIPPSNIVIVDNDGSEAAKQIKDFFESEDVKKYITVLDTTEEVAQEKLMSGEITAVIIIPETYGEDVDAKRKVSLLFYADKGSPVESSIVKSILERYVNPANNMIAATSAAEGTFQEYKIDPRVILEDIEKTIKDQDSIVKDGGFGGAKDTLSAMQYYSAAMVSMYILFVGMLGTTSLMEEREKGTFRRLLATSVSRSHILAGKILGNILLGMIDTTILILFTKFVYKVDWGDSVFGVILLTMAMAFAASGFSIFVATVFKSGKTVDIVMPMMILIISFVGGNMYPLYEMSELLRRASMILMNNWALRGYLNLMMNNGVHSVSIPSLVLCGMGVLFMTVGVVKLKVE